MLRLTGVVMILACLVGCEGVYVQESCPVCPAPNFYYTDCGYINYYDPSFYNPYFAPYCGDEWYW